MTQSMAEEVAMLDADAQRAFFDGLSDEVRAGLLFHWAFWARPEQLPPPGNWFCWALISGRGFGKTRTGAEWIRGKVQEARARGQPIRIALVAETAADCRDVMIEGPSGILAISDPAFRPVYQPSRRQLTWPDGSYAKTYSGDAPDQLRGPQFDCAWVDELAKFTYAEESWDNLEFGLRQGRNPQVCVTTTPRPVAIIRRLLNDPQTVVTGGSSYDNLANLAPSYIERIIRRYEGTRLGEQELHARLLDDVPGALWTYALIEMNRRSAMPEMRRIVIGVDPAARGPRRASALRAHHGRDREDNEAEPNETGIVACGLGVDGHGYVFHDMSERLSPGAWANRVVHAYREYGCDRVVAEVNNGGDMVEHTLRTVAPNISYRDVWAARNKVARAEPIAALYEQGKIHHVGIFPALESQMLATTDQGYTGSGSPDRMDAMVWALTDLMLGGASIESSPAAYANVRG